MKLNKKGYSIKLFGFFFALVFVSALMMFLGVGMHFILNDFGIQQVKESGQALIDNPLNANSIALDNYAQGHYDYYVYYDYIFLILILSLFIETIYSAAATRSEGWFSFFGYATIGNVLLLFLMGYATQIQGWILNEFVYKFLLIEINTPIMSSFIEYSPAIITFWYLLLLAVSRLDLVAIKENIAEKFGKNKEEVNFEE